MSDRYRWLLYVALAGLAWGTYVPLIFYGGSELGGKAASRLLAILCVGVAYFLIGVLVPAFYLLRTPRGEQPAWTATGLLFSGLAGAAGAIGAICVIFATKAAADSARAEDLEPATYKLYIAPLIFGLAPIINTLVSMVWHPKKGNPAHFGFTPPHWTLWAGIFAVAAGAALVLLSKELTESKSANVDVSALLGNLGAVLSAPWVLYVALAGLAWGTYVPLIFYGGSELGGKSASRLLAILCVGVAYFLIAVVYPAVYLLQTPADQQPSATATGLTFSGLAGAAGAIGAICVIFATKSAVDAAKSARLPPATYKLYIAPLIFGLAPIINTLVSMVWHPESAQPFHVASPHWTLWAGILAVGLGAALVLYSKELSESAPKPPPVQP